MDIEKNLNTISKKLSNYNAKLIPVIKNRTVEEVKEVYNCGFREFGENRLDDYFLHSDKFDDAVFHFIAPIQSRKIKVIFENFFSASCTLFSPKLQKPKLTSSSISSSVLVFVTINNFVCLAFISSFIFSNISVFIGKLIS